MKILKYRWVDFFIVKILQKQSLTTAYMHLNFVAHSVVQNNTKMLYNLCI